jgi:hypothetical protein
VDVNKKIGLRKLDLRVWIRLNWLKTSQQNAVRVWYWNIYELVNPFRYFQFCISFLADFSLLSLFLLNESKFKSPPCHLCITLYQHLNGQTNFMELFKYIMAPEPIWIAYFINPSHQSECLYVYSAIIARQWLNKKSYSGGMQSMSYLRKVRD